MKEFKNKRVFCCFSPYYAKQKGNHWAGQNCARIGAYRVVQTLYGRDVITRLYQIIDCVCYNRARISLQRNNASPLPNIKLSHVHSWSRIKFINKRCHCNLVSSRVWKKSKGHIRLSDILHSIHLLHIKMQLCEPFNYNIKYLTTQ